VAAKSNHLSTKCDPCSHGSYQKMLSLLLPGTICREASKSAEEHLLILSGSLDHGLLGSVCLNHNKLSRRAIPILSRSGIPR
jgi:hypothetical protein